MLLVAGGSGLVPLMAMIRTRASAAVRPPFRLIYSVRSPADALYGPELTERQRADGDLAVIRVYTRSVPPGWPLPPGRISPGVLAWDSFPPSASPSVFVCGPTGFVEAAAGLLVDAGHDPGLIRTERFG